MGRVRGKVALVTGAARGQGRAEALRLAGISQSILREEHNIAFVVRRCVIDFLKPALLDDLLDWRVGADAVDGTHGRTPVLL